MLPRPPRPPLGLFPEITSHSNPSPSQSCYLTLEQVIPEEHSLAIVTCTQISISGSASRDPNLRHLPANYLLKECPFLKGGGGGVLIPTPQSGILNHSCSKITDNPTADVFVFLHVIVVYQLEASVRPHGLVALPET